MTKTSVQLRPHQLVLLIAGPAASGKSTAAARVGAMDGWCHLSEDDVWNELGHEGLREDHEQVIVHDIVHSRLLQYLLEGKSVALEFILFHNPPQPLFDYQRFLAQYGIPCKSRILRPSLDALLRRALQRGRDDDVSGLEEFKRNAQHQLACISAVDPSWVVDTSEDDFEAAFETHFRSLAERGPRESSDSPQ
ncbi:MAG: ATP-binding protein [Candidatus Obscuribacterales bacterium]|nr:ATP-binding protein [Candidatus Obscuribacterales bacterium]